MFGLLSIFPGLGAAISIYGLFATPATAIQHIELFSGILPPAAWDILNTELQDIASQQQTTLTVAAVVGLLIALWSARSAMSALIAAAHIAYNERERRGIVAQIVLSLVLTIGAILGFLVMVLIGIAVPVVLDLLGTSSWVQTLIAVARWMLLWFFAVVALALLYRYAPARVPARWHWVTWGSCVAASLWMTASFLLSLYLRSFASYSKTYGALAGVIALLMWFYVSSLIVVLGTEINAEMERQTLRDTTEGEEAPVGKRGAYAADTVGPSADPPRYLRRRQKSRV